MNDKFIPLHAGQQAAEGISNDLILAEKGFSDSDRVMYWSAIMAHLGGIMAASIGQDAVSAIHEMTNRCVAHVAKTHIH